MTRCSCNYAKRVLKAIEDGTVDDLKRRAKRKTAITETEWPERVIEALLLPTNSRAQPGNAFVSVAYGVRKPKMWLRKSKLKFVQELLAKYGDEALPSVSTMFTLIPKNYVQPGEGDRENNCCVGHSNMYHMSKNLRSVIPSLPSHSRELSCLVMCPASPSNLRDIWDPLTWRRECALRYCRLI